MKYNKVLLLLLAWEGVIWLGYNGHLLRPQVWMLFSKQRIYEGFYIGSEYYNAGSYLLVLAITSVIAMEYCLKAEGILALVRCRSRTTFCSRRSKTLVTVSMLYVLIHFALGYGLSLVLFPGIFVQSKQTALFYGASVLLLFLFFLRVNVVYVLLRDFFNKKIFAMAGILAVYILEYFLGYYVLIDIWMPCKDVDMGRLAYLGSLGGLEFVLVLARQGGVTLLIALLSLKYFDRKDVIQVEK